MSRRTRRSGNSYAKATAGQRPMAMVGRKHPALHRAADPLTDIDESIIQLADRMRTTLGPLHGYALAAPQVGRSIQLVVSDTRLHTSKGAWPLVAINPEIVEADGRLIADKEGCLSLPGRWYEVERYERIVMRCLDTDGTETTREATGLAARLWQHEVDHLNGLILAGRYPEMR